MDPSGVYTARQLARQNPSSPTSDTVSATVPEHTKAVLERQLYERNQRGWRRIVLNFTPSWFSVTMGTGIVSILLHNLPYNAVWIHYLSIIVYVLNVLLFVTFTLISIARYTIYKGIFGAMLSHPVQSLFTGMSSPPILICL